MGLTIGVDVGGTKVAAGVVDEYGRIVEKLKRFTPAASPGGTISVIAGVVNELLGRYEVEAVGIGAAGFVDQTRSTVLFAPNLAWRDEPVKKLVEERIGRPVVVENDANAAAWAEAKLGAARGLQQVMLITVGTGIGAGIVLDGKLYRGRFGSAGEPGHYRVVPEGRLCGCGNRGCWEQYASGSALVAEAREFARRSPEAAVRLLQLGGGTAEGIDGPAVTIAAREGDIAALRCFEIVGNWLGAGLADLAAILDPGCFVIGGGVSEAGELLVNPAREAYEHGLTGRSHREFADVRLAELGPDAGLIGAADLAKNGTADSASSINTARCARSEDPVGRRKCEPLQDRSVIIIVPARMIAELHHQGHETADKRGDGDECRLCGDSPVQEDASDQQVARAADDACQAAFDAVSSLAGGGSGTGTNGSSASSGGVYDRGSPAGRIRRMRSIGIVKPSSACGVIRAPADPRATRSALGS